MTAPDGPQPGGISGAQSDSTLAERAARAARAELRGERGGILCAIGQTTLAPLTRARTVPERWTLLHVMERLEEAFRILARLPMPTRPKGYINSMPIYLYDRGDLNSQLETYSSRKNRLPRWIALRKCWALYARQHPDRPTPALLFGFVDFLKERWSAHNWPELVSIALKRFVFVSKMK